MDMLHASLLGIIEGLTEFLPISSTGHLILASEVLGIQQDAFHKTFEVSIQLGAILAVITLYYRRLFAGFELWMKLGVAFLPAGVLGFLLYPYIEALFSPATVAYALIVGGIIFIFIEWFQKERESAIANIDKIGYKEAFLIGCFQALAMIPGTSRSGSTIIGGLLLGLDRRVATEFSFLLAIPTMCAATAYTLYKNSETLDPQNFSALGIGFLTAFIFALLAIKGFLSFISRFNFIPFGIYRIILGTLFLFYLGLL